MIELGLNIIIVEKFNLDFLLVLTYTRKTLVQWAKHARFYIQILFKFPLLLIKGVKINFFSSLTLLDWTVLKKKYASISFFTSCWSLKLGIPDSTNFSIFSTLWTVVTDECYGLQKSWTKLDFRHEFGSYGLNLAFHTEKLLLLEW